MTDIFNFIAVYGEIEAGAAEVPVVADIIFRDCKNLPDLPKCGSA